MVDLSPLVERVGGEGSLYLSLPLNQMSSTSPLFILHYSSGCWMLCMLYYLKCQLLLGLTLFTVNLPYSVLHIHLLIKKKRSVLRRSPWLPRRKVEPLFFVFSFHNTHSQTFVIRDTKMTKHSSSIVQNFNRNHVSKDRLFVTC